VEDFEAGRSIRGGAHPNNLENHRYNEIAVQNIAGVGHGFRSAEPVALRLRSAVPQIGHNKWVAQGLEDSLGFHLWLPNGHSFNGGQDVLQLSLHRA